MSCLAELKQSTIELSLEDTKTMVVTRELGRVYGDGNGGGSGAILGIPF